MLRRRTLWASLRLALFLVSAGGSLGFFALLLPRLLPTYPVFFGTCVVEAADRGKQLVCVRPAASLHKPHANHNLLHPTCH